MCVAYDLVCFVAFLFLSSQQGGYTCMKLSMLPSVRSRRVVLNGGPHLSVAYDLACFITFLSLHKLCLKNV